MTNLIINKDLESLLNNFSNCRNINLLEQKELQFDFVQDINSYAKIFPINSSKLSKEVRLKKELNLETIRERKMPVIGIWDWDGSLKSYNKLAIKFSNYFVDSSFNSCNGFKKTFLELGASLLPTNFYPTIIELAQKTNSSFDYSCVYTLGKQERVINPLTRNHYLSYFNNIISTKKKQPGNLIDNLEKLTRYSRDELENNAIIINFGDNRIDMKTTEFCKHKINVGIESGLEKRKDEFMSLCDIYIPKNELKNKKMPLELYSIITKYVELQQKNY